MAVTYFDRDTYQRKPEWLKVPLPTGEDFKDIRDNLRKNGLSTVCEEAKCPNISECWSARTATIMILGDTCTRACKFCHVKTGNPKGFINHEEIENSAKMVGIMALKYVVITSVDRDDVADHGSGHFAAVVDEVHRQHPDTKVEVLIPDFAGIPEHMHTLARSQPFVIAQNIETVRRLTHPVRDPRAGYDKTLACLAFYKQHYPHIRTKTSLQVGHGETWDEIQATLEDLRDVGCDIVTFGQYLQPSKRHLDVKRFYTPAEFDELKRMAQKLGFQFVASGPLVRSSYKAADFLAYADVPAGDE
jgi:lipoic acid synthetase